MATRRRVLEALAARPSVLKAGPRLVLFLLGYMRKFRIREVDGALIVHSHLPPLNSPAYGRFINEHLTRRNTGPSHAQIAITHACPQHCDFCYNRERTGTPLATADILQAIDTLADMGVFWLGLTGGEPLLNPDILEIVAHAAKRCAVKLFTTGCTLTPARAAELKRAGVFSVCVSIDDWREDVHDRGRNYPGAFQTALQALRMFQDAGLDTGASCVLSKELITSGAIRELLAFLEGLGVNEAWLSEVKPSSPAFWDERVLVGETERQALRELQDRYNRSGPLTINYLGHFESGAHFGCNAGHKMIYIDAFGEVSPCVFTPITFGNVRDRALPDIWAEMTTSFRPSSTCFINENWQRIRSRADGAGRLSVEQTGRLMQDVAFGDMPRFYQLYYRRHGPPLPGPA
jgi:MoaA/NifB/PqqE/SkfB family radical SAM enzyme